MRDAQGVHGSGPTKYTPEQYSKVCGIIRECVGVPLTVAMLAEVTNMDGNTVRAIARDADGVEFVLAESSNGYMAARTTQEANKGTRRLLNQIDKMRTRIDRRLAYTNAQLT